MRERERTSSSSPGNTFLLRSFSENPGNTLNRPFKKVAFSSRDLLENEAGSRKFSVEIANEEKYGWDGREGRDNRVCGVRVINLVKISAVKGRTISHYSLSHTATKREKKPIKQSQTTYPSNPPPPAPTWPHPSISPSPTPAPRILSHHAPNPDT